MARFKVVNGDRVPLTAEEEAARDAEEAAWLSTLVARLREKDFLANVEAATSQFTAQELTVLLALYTEVNLYKLAVLVGQQGAVETRGINAIKAEVLPAQTKAQIATMIENRVGPAIEAAAVALATKIRDGG